ncbi:hypothetical protein Tco_1395531 [Tanacetum coccineum]
MRWWLPPKRTLAEWWLQPKRTLFGAAEKPPKQNTPLSWCTKVVVMMLSWLRWWWFRRAAAAAAVWHGGGVGFAVVVRGDDVGGGEGGVFGSGSGVGTEEEPVLVSDKLPSDKLVSSTWVAVPFSDRCEASISVLENEGPPSTTEVAHPSS